MPTVVPYALTSKAKVKAHLGISASTDDNLIDTLISGVTDYIERVKCHRRFALQTGVVQYFDGTGDKIFLRERPIAQVSLVEYRGGNIASTTFFTYNSNYYGVYADSGYLLFPGGMIQGYKNIRVTYDAGYLIDFTDEFNTAAHTLPFDLSQVATNMTAKTYQLRGTEGRVRESTEGQSVDYEKTMTEDDKAVLNRYMNHPFGI